jgi:hypothetical protein
MTIRHLRLHLKRWILGVPQFFTDLAFSLWQNPVTKMAKPRVTLHRTRREEGLSNLAVTCGEVWGEAVTSVAPPAFLAVARAGSPARGQAGFSRPPGRPRIRVSRERSKRMDGGTGLWRRLRPVTGARRFVPETTRTCFGRGPCPGPLSEAVTAGRMRDTIRRISGPRAICPTPRMFRLIRGMHIKPTSERHSLRAALRIVLCKTPASKRAEGFRALL